MAKKVVVYSTPTCPYCQKAKDYLKQKNVEFAEIDVSIDQKAAKKIVDETQQMSVPVIQINKDYVVGFDQAKIDQLISQ